MNQLTEDEIQKIRDKFKRTGKLKAKDAARLCAWASYAAGALRSKILTTADHSVLVFTFERGMERDELEAFGAWFSKFVPPGRKIGCTALVQGLKVDQISEEELRAIGLQWIPEPEAQAG